MSIGEPRLSRSPRPGGRSSGTAQFSAEDWEVRIGEQLRRARIDAGLDQSQLAGLADLSIGALRSLERGTGSTVRSLVRVARALGREHWLDSIAPAVAVRPIDVLRGASRPRTRVYRSRSARNPDAEER